MVLNKDKLYKIIDWIIPSIFIISIFECYFSIWHLSTLIKMVSIFATLLLLVRGDLHSNQITFKAFFLVTLFSPIAYIYNGRPLECLSSDLMNTVPAMLLFLVGVNDKRHNRTYYDLMMYVGTSVLFLGILCYVLTPGWYTNSLVAALNSSRFSSFNYDETLLLESLRFSSFFEDSYPVSLLSVYILAISLFNYFRRDKKLKYSLLCAWVSFASAVLCMHRVSIASSFLIVFIFMLYECVNGNCRNIIKILCAICVLLIIAYFVSSSIRDRLLSLQDMLTTRTENMSFSSAYNERQGLSKKLMSQWCYPIFGHGLGSGGPTSRFLGYGGVTDAAYTKLLFENGIIGVCTFITLMITSIIRGVKYLKYYIVELSVVSFVGLAMTGSNSLSLAYLYILPFWYMMGRIWNVDYFEYAKKNKINI